MKLAAGTAPIGDRLVTWPEADYFDSEGPVIPLCHCVCTDELDVHLSLSDGDANAKRFPGTVYIVECWLVLTMSPSGIFKVFPV